MQPKFTLRDLGSGGIRVLAIALVLALSTQISFSQARPAVGGQKPAPAAQADKIKAKAERVKNGVTLKGNVKADNDAGLPARNAVPKPVSTNRTEAICQTVNGSLSSGDATVNVRPFRDGILPGACVNKTGCQAGISAPGSFVDVISWTNPISTPQCVTITYTMTAITGGTFTFLTVHEGTFDPANFCTNWISDVGTSPALNVPVTITFNLAGNATANIAISSVGAIGSADYTLVIDAPICSAAPCSGTPAPGNTVSTANPVCPLVNFTLSAQNNTPGSGVTYQWQSSPDGVAWSNIASATNSTLTRSQSVATWYRVNVTCAGNTTATTGLLVGINPPSSCYCIPPASDCTDSDVITRVRISTLDNATTCEAGPPAGYGNYTGLPPTTVYSGAANRITVDVPLVWPEGVAVWIDYNRNGAFEASEHTVVGNNSAGGTISNNINIPSTVTPGNTRMRVRVLFNGIPGGGDACTAFVFGETEDYTVNIQPCVPVTVTTNPANTSVACGANASFTVVTAGSLPAYAWEYRVNASSPWQMATNGSLFSGATTATLTLNNVPSNFSGYQFRALVSGGCSAVDFSAFATLTVTQIVPVVNPSSATICIGTIQPLSLTNTLGNVKMFEESFNTVTPLPTGWVTQNNSTPVGVLGWFQGNPAVFPSNTGAPEAYIAANFNSVAGANTISNWLITPEVNMKNGDIFSFWTRKVSGSAFPDRMEVRMSTAGSSTNVGNTNSSVGDFTTLLLTINPSLTTTGYPDTWTKYDITVSGVTGTVGGRFAFRYFVTNGGPSGANSDFIGIDDVSFTSVGGIAQGIWSGPTGTMWTDAAATVQYTGTPATTIYVNPTVTSNYTVMYTTLTPCTSATTTVPVNVVNPISAVVNPVSTAACLGTNATFTASATGGPIGYQWQVSTDGGVTWTNISGATSATLNLTGVTQLMHNNLYRAVLTAAPCAGSFTTTAATLTINALPVVTLTTSDPSLAPGQQATLTASSTPPAMANGYAWTFDHNPIPGNGNTQTIGVDDQGAYQVTVTDVNGCVASSNELVIGAEASDRLWIYPNPTTGKFQVRLYYNSDVAERRVVTIYNQLGQAITSRHFDLVSGTTPYLQMDFDLGTVQRGIYVVKVAHQFNGKVTSGLVVVQ